MVGLRQGVAGVFMGVASLGASARAVACTPSLPPAALVGYPSPDEREVPTNAIPIFNRYRAGISNEQNLPASQFRVTDGAGATVAVTPRVAVGGHFELVPERVLEPSTTYTIHVTPPPPTTGEPVTLSVSFTTGSGPLSVPATPPDFRLQHYHSTGVDMSSSCDPGTNGSCIFSSPAVALEVSHAEDPSDVRYLVFDGLFENLTGVNQGTPWSCATLRARAADGTMSAPVDVCRDDGESFTLPDTSRLVCTGRGFVKNGVPIDGSGGTATGGTGGVATGGTGGIPTGGTSTGGAETGGSTTGGAETGGSTGGTETGGTGTGDSAGAPDDDSESRTVVTEGCGCRVPGSAGRSGPAAWLALGVCLLVVTRLRRRSERGRPTTSSS